MRRTTALLLVLAGLAGSAAPGAASPSFATAGPRVLVNGDSLAFDSLPFLRRALPRFRLVEAVWFARRASEGAAVLRGYGRRLPRLLHVSLGTADDPLEVDRFRASVRAIMRVAGQRRCVVWANIWRPVPSGPGFDGFNLVLADEDARRGNLRVVDWAGMVAAHTGWLKSDGVHVDDAGNRARARAVGRELRRCSSRLAAPAPARSLLAVGDSLGVFTMPHLKAELRRWRVRGELRPAREAVDGPRVLARAGPLPPVIHLSLGTIDEPGLHGPFRRALARMMRLAGPRRCVVWTNIFRPARDGVGYDGFNAILDEEDARRENLRVVDWEAMVDASPHWLGGDAVHVTAEGYRARARAVAAAVRRCRAWLDATR